MVRQFMDRAVNLVRRGGQPSGMRSGLQLLAQIGVKPATIADVGAANGDWSRLARKTFPASELVLFEPQPVHAAELDRFKTENPDATVLRSAVGGSSGTSLFDATDPWGGVLQREPNSGSITVPVVTLDVALAEAKPPLLVKLDTHGVEAEILAGAQQTLTRSVAWIVEAYNFRVAGEALMFWDLCGYMETKGFRPIDLVDVMHRPHDDTLWQLDLFFIQSEWAGFDYLGYT